VHNKYFFIYGQLCVVLGTSVVWSGSRDASDATSLPREDALARLELSASTIP
jgi:hypothetical protein